MEQYRKPVENLDARLNCPRHGDLVMMRYFFGPQRTVMVDECPGCGGVWLDPDELGHIRGLYKTEAERDAAGRQFVEQLAQTSGLSQMVADSQAKAEKAQRFARMFKWICPSAYIPGKQEWGAF